MTDAGSRRNRPYAPRMSPQARREQLLDAVLRVIVDDGVHRVSMDAVARAAGVTRPVVYGQFTDAADLLRAALDREESAALAQLRTVLPSAGSPSSTVDAFASLAAFLEAVLAAPDRWRAIFTLVDSSTPEFRRRVEQGLALVIDEVEALVRRSVGPGADDGTDVELLARMLVGIAWAAGRLTLAEPDAYPPARLVAFARTTIAPMLLGSR